ncbi:hypothetical protein LZ31DRAFT_39102 [Colletotrichum somersetense]|nr:hypothetical protein LZ31DRAFT_39102 [Colletotrichum somersetense]
MREFEDICLHVSTTPHAVPTVRPLNMGIAGLWASITEPTSKRWWNSAKEATRFTCRFQLSSTIVPIRCCSTKHIRRTAPRARHANRQYMLSNQHTHESCSTSIHMPSSRAPESTGHGGTLYRGSCRARVFSPHCRINGTEKSSLLAWPAYRLSRAQR